MSDLNYYGAYSNVPGYGMMWQPYFTGVGWDPFMNGAWSFYPGYGYMFASSYPWGWMPYRYGNWMFVPSMGWMWQPGGWNTWLTVPRYSGAVPTNFRPPVVPVAGTGGTGSTVIVGRTGVGTVVTPSRSRRKCRFGRLGNSARFVRKSQSHEPSGRQVRIRRSASRASVFHDFT